mmetsp:Transcript_37446/g.105735  ORF Transcript_37446/g.105735 Transcript_37446/m.105735 type:complete len:306 (-) Transcript_37446:404-1321(-)
MEDIKCSVHVHNLGALGRNVAVAELDDSPACGEELGSPLASHSLIAGRAGEVARRGATLNLLLSGRQLPGRREVALQGFARRRGLAVWLPLGSAAEQHPANNVCRGDSLSALNGLESTQLLGVLIGVGAIRQQAGVVPVHNVVDPVLCEEFMDEVRVQIVRHPGDDLVYPLHAADHDVALLFVLDRGTLAAEDLRVWDEPHHQLLPACFGLPEAICMPIVHHVKAAVHVDPDGVVSAPVEGVGLEPPRKHSTDAAWPVLVLVRHVELVGFEAGPEAGTRRGCAHPYGCHPPERLLLLALIRHCVQ